MPISLRCSGCGKEYRLRDELAGKRARCGCGVEMTVPTDAGEPTKPHSTESAPSHNTPAEPSPPGRRKVPNRREKRTRIIVGVLSILYGSIWVVATPIIREGLLRVITGVSLAVAIVIGGVMILRRHPSGPGCAGLACVFLFFFKVWYLFLAVLTALSIGEISQALMLVLVIAVVFSIPAFIVYWSLKQEAAKQKAEWEPYP